MEIQNSEEIEELDETIPEEIEELTPEQKELQERFFRGFIIKKNKYHLCSIFNYMREHELTLENVLEEIRQKKCKLSAVQREFITSFKLDFIDQLLFDMYGNYYRTSNLVEEGSGCSEMDSEQAANVSGFSVSGMDQEDASSGAQSDSLS